jgi:hypothetical protein
MKNELAYINIHTPHNQKGEIRGPILPVRTTTTNWMTDDKYMKRLL